MIRSAGSSEIERRAAEDVGQCRDAVLRRRWRDTVSVRTSINDVAVIIAAGRSTMQVEHRWRVADVVCTRPHASCCNRCYRIAMRMMRRGQKLGRRQRRRRRRMLLMIAAASDSAATELCASVLKPNLKRRGKQEIRANARQTRDSISLTSYAGCLGLSPVISPKIHSSNVRHSLKSRKMH